MEELVNLLKEKGLYIASCESLTGGSFCSSLVEISGASSVYKGSLITYSNDMKSKLASVDNKLIEKYGVISAEVANAMAKNVALLCESDIGVSFSGNAGPTVLENKPVGLVFSSIYFRNETFSFEDLLSGNRLRIKNQSVDLMIKRVIEKIKKI